MRRILLLLATMVTGVLVASGVALAANISCPGTGDACVGTEESDRITGSEQNEYIIALGGGDVVAARGGDDAVDGDAGADDISGGVGADTVSGGRGPDNIEGGPGTPVSTEPPFTFECGSGDARTEGNQVLFGENGNDILTGGPDNDALLDDTLGSVGGRNTLSGNGGDDCLILQGDPNERVRGGDGDDIIFAADGNGDDIFCGTGIDTVEEADEEDRVAANCENVLVVVPSSLQSEGTTPEAEVSITTPEGTTTMTP